MLRRMYSLKHVTAFASVTMLTYAATMTGLSSALPEIAQSLGIATTRAGILFTLHFIGFLAAILLSLGVASVSARMRLVLAAAAAYAIALVGIAFAPGIATFAPTILLVGAGGGLLESHTAGLQSTLARDAGEASSQIAISQVFFALGALAAPVALSLTASRSGSWRYLFVVLGLIAFAATIAGLWSRLRAPGRATGSAYAAVRSEPPLHQDAPSPPASPGGLVLASVAIALYVGAEVTVFGWMPTVMEVYVGAPAARAKLTPALFWIAMMLGRIVVARLARRTPPRGILTIASFGGAVAAALLALSAAEWYLWAVLALVALCFAGVWPLIVAVAGSHRAGSAAIVVAAGGLGGALFPSLAGLAAEILPGRLIPALAAPLMLAVALLSAISGRAERRPVPDA